MQPPQDLVHFRPCMLVGIKEQEQKVGRSSPPNWLTSKKHEKKLAVVSCSSKGLHKKDFLRAGGPSESFIQVQIEYCLKPKLPRALHRSSGDSPKGSQQSGRSWDPPCRVTRKHPPNPSTPPERRRGVGNLGSQTFICWLKKHQ